VPVLAAVGVAAVFTVLIQTVGHMEKLRGEERAALLENLRYPAP